MTTGGVLQLNDGPLQLRLTLVYDADFVAVITPLDPATGAATTFAAGTSLVLDFGDTEWAATVTSTPGSSAATWNVDKAAVNVLIDALAPGARCSLRYALGTVDRIWARGEVLVDR